MAITLKGTLTGNVIDPLNAGVVPIYTLSPAAGDLYIVTVQSGIQTSDANFSNTVAGNVTYGFTKLVDLYANDTNDTNLAVWTAISQGNDSTINLGVTSSNFSYLIRIYSGVDTTTPLDVAQQPTATGTNGDSANPPSIVTATPGALVVPIYAAAQNFSALWATTPANLNNFVQDIDATARTIIGIGDATVASPGAFDPAAATGGDGSTRDSWIGVTLALRPVITSISLIIGDAVSASQTTSPTLTNHPLTLTVDSSTSAALATALTLGYNSPSVPLTISSPVSQVFNNGQVYGGPDLLGGAGSFTSATGWNILPGQGISITGGQFVSDGSNTSLRQTSYNTGKTGLIGKSYRILADFNVTAGTVFFSYAGVQTPSQTAPASGSISYAANATGAVDNAAVAITTNSAVTADNFQIYDNTYNVLLSAKTALTVGSLTSAAQVAAVILSAKTALLLNNGISTSQTSTLNLGNKAVLAPADDSSPSQASAPTLTTRTTLTAVAGAISASLTTSPSLAPKTLLGLASAVSASTSGVPSLGTKQTLAPANDNSTSLAGVVTLAPKTSLTVANMVSGSTASQTTILQSPIQPNPAISASVAGSPTLQSKYSLTPANDNSASSTTSLVVSPKTSLGVNSLTSVSQTGAVILTNVRSVMVVSPPVSGSAVPNIIITSRTALLLSSANSASTTTSPLIAKVVLPAAAVSASLVTQAVITPHISMFVNNMTSASQATSAVTVTLGHTYSEVGKVSAYGGYDLTPPVVIYKGKFMRQAS